jgi:2'-5' RNA ligase
VRLFVAINLPATTRIELHDAMEAVRTAGMPVRWVAAESLHLTLEFLGEVAESRVVEITTALENVGRSSPPFAMRVAGAGAFPNLRNPRVVWMGVHPEPALMRAQVGMARALQGIGFEVETRPWSPHITLGRAGKDARAPAFGGLEALARRITYDTVVDVVSIDLMRSQLARSGARYERIGVAPLIGEPIAAGNIGRADA